jgi:hypothetical protein
VKAVRDEEGNLWIEDLLGPCVATLRRVPQWLEREDPELRARLFPDAYDDPVMQQEWRRNAAPELEHLFLSRVEIVRKDLKSLARGRHGRHRLRIGRGHESAWLSSLNAARLALFEMHHLTAEDMSRDLEDVADPQKLEALLQIALMAYVQQLLIDSGA